MQCLTVSNMRRILTRETVYSDKGRLRKCLGVNAFSTATIECSAQCHAMDNTTPGLERAIWLLQHLSQHPDGLGAADLVEASGVPRATLYRIVRTLRAHDFVSPLAGDESKLILGPGLTALAKRAMRPADLVRVVQPFMDALSHEIGETVKFVVREGLEVVTLSVTQSMKDSRIAVRVGTRIPLHVGASQRLLLAFAPPEVQKEVLAGPMKAAASRTVTSPVQLRRDIKRIRAQGHTSGFSEGVEGVGAFAAAVRDPFGVVGSAIVAVYIHAGKTAEERRRIGQITQRAAERASSALLT